VVGKAQGAGPSGNEDPLPEVTAKEQALHFQKALL